MFVALQTNILPGAVFGQLEWTGADRLTIEQLLTIFFRQLRRVFGRHNGRIVSRQVPEEGGIRSGQRKFNRPVIQLAHALNSVGKLQAVEIGEVAAVDVMPRVIAVKDTLERKDHIVRVQLARGGKPRRALKRHIITKMKTVGCAVIQYFPALRQLGDQTVGVRINIKQPIVKLGGEGIHNQAAARFLRVEGVHLAADAIDEAAVSNVRLRRLPGRSKGQAAKQTECKKGR